MDLETVFEGVELSDDAKAILVEKFQGALGAEVEGLKGKNTELLGKLSETKTAAQKLSEGKALAEEEKQKALGNYEEAQRLADERIKKEREQFSATNEALEGQLRELYVTNANHSLASELANTPEDIEILSMFLQKHISMQKGDDGKFQTTYGDAGSREALIEQMKSNATYARFIKGTGATGVGAKGANGSGKASISDKKYSEMSLDEQIAFNSK